MNDSWCNVEIERVECDLTMLKGNRLWLDEVELKTGEKLTLFAAGGGYYIEETSPDGAVVRLEWVDDRIVYPWPTNEDRLLARHGSSPPDPH